MSTAPDLHTKWPPPDTPEVREALAREEERYAAEAGSEFGRQLYFLRAQMIRDGAPFETDEQLLAEFDIRRGRG